MKISRQKMRTNNGFEYSCFVFCPECFMEHDTREVEFLGISEDIQGRDVMQYTCPVMGEDTHTLVYRR